jgi:hypothetical protein
VSPVMAEIPDHAHLARAYLAIADDPEPPAVQRSLPRSLCGVLAALVLVAGAPLAWTSSATGKALDLPAAATLKSEDDEDGDQWAATDG